MYHILICDDSSFMRNMLQVAIDKTNQFSVVGEAENGLRAVQKYKELKPDVVTLDITMPEMQGLEALEKILEYDKSANVIMVSAMGQQSFVVDALKAGAKDFIVKPFDSQRVQDALFRAMSERQ